MLKKKIDLVILAGGKGSRIKKLTKNFPKPLVKFNKISFLQYLINYYAQFNFRSLLRMAPFFHKRLGNILEDVSRPG